MNIILINHSAGSPDMGMEYRPYYIAKEWLKMGHNVMIVAASFHHIRSTQPEGISKDGSSEHRGVNYYFIKTPAYKGSGPARILNMLCFVFKLCRKSRKIAKSFKPDVVIASSTYPSDIYPAKRIARISKAKLAFEVHDIWPLSPMLLGGYSKYHPFIMAMAHGERYACKHANSFISILPATKDHYVEKGMDADKWFYVPNGIEEDSKSMAIPPPEDFMKKMAKIKNAYKHIALYTGSHGIANSLETVVDAAAHLKNKEIAIVLVGKGPDKDDLINRAKKISDNIFFLDPVPKEAIHGVLEMADVLLIAWNRSELYKYGIGPNKLFDYMMAGKPIVHAVDTPVDLVQEAKCGISIEPENPELFAKAIEDTLSLPESERSSMGKNGTDYVLKNHTYSVLAEKYLQYIST